MNKVYIKINLTNVSREEQEDLINYLEENCWDFKEIKEEEK